MDSIRQQKFSKLIQKELGQIIQKKYSFLNPGGLITVTGVRVSSDLGIAKAYVSIFGKEEKKVVLTALNDLGKDIRFELGQLIRNQIRVIPNVTFFLDDSLDEAMKIDALLRK